jgi:hypothetical protein
MLKSEWCEVGTLLDRSEHNVWIVAKPLGGKGQSMTILGTDGKHDFLVISKAWWDRICLVHEGGFKAIEFKARKEDFSVEAKSVWKGRDKAAFPPTHRIRNDITLERKQYILFLAPLSSAQCLVGGLGVTQERCLPHLPMVLFS